MNEQEAILKISEYQDVITESTEIITKHRSAVIESKKSIVLLNNHIRNLKIRSEGKQLFDLGMDEFRVWGKLSYKYGLSRSTTRGIYFNMKTDV